MTELTLRARRILQAVVQEYLQTGDAVGSRTVTRRYGIELSPATVRNVMADLEELGLLKQPHTSAGRIPTDDGLRFFIDSLLKVRSLSPKEREDIRARYALQTADFDDVLQTTSRVLSELSHHAAIVIMPAPQRRVLEHVEFLRLRGDQLLAVLVVEGGQVENRLVKLELPGDPGFLERVNNYLNEKVKGRTLEEVRTGVLEELGRDKNQLDTLAAHALRLGEQVFKAGSAPAVIVSGQAHLFDEGEGADGPVRIDRMRALLSALEEKEGVVRLLDRTLAAEGIQVWVGAESPFRDIADVSVVGAPYGPEDRPVGSIAVVGPTRMNYSRVIPLVDFTAELVSGLLAGKR
ncbi:MAG TPA: heat-inducible transcriptional repressor HrcA [Haliangiales bacterium]|nr:heat-inducible transcriptional repressor HrcA [Haliangiales bacterium]